MSDLWQLHLKAVSAWREANPHKRVLPGIFSDVYGTLIDFNARNRDLAVFLADRYAQGDEVTIFSSAPDSPVCREVATLGLPEEIAGVRHKRRYGGRVVELMIDDDPPGDVKAVTLWNPKDPAVREFLRAYREELEKKGDLPVLRPAPPPRGPGL